MRRFAIALVVGGMLALTLVATPAAGAQTETEENQTVVGVEVDAWTVSGVQIDEDDSVERARAALASNLSVSADNVRLQPENGTAEVFGPNLTLASIGAGFEAAGFSPDTVRKGVTEPTRERVVAVLQNRLDAREGNASAETVTVEGRQYVVVTGASPRTVGEILANPGRLDVLAHYPVETNGGTVYQQTRILTHEDFVGVGEAYASRPYTDEPSVEVHLSVPAARQAAGVLKEAGFTDEGVTGCPEGAVNNPESAEGYCLYTYFNGEIRSAISLGGDLAWSINFENYEEDPSVLIYTDTMREAEILSRTLRAGAFPVPLSASEVPESVARAALATEGEDLDEEVDVGSDPIQETPEETPEVTPDETTSEEPVDTTTEESTEEPSGTTAAESTDEDGPVTVTDSGALGPGFTPLTAFVAVVLAGVALLARRVR